MLIAQCLNQQIIDPHKHTHTRTHTEGKIREILESLNLRRNYEIRHS